MPLVVKVTCSNSLSPHSVLSSTLSEMASVRAELLTYFTHILLGDALVAEFFILHLISNVYVKFNLYLLYGFMLRLFLNLKLRLILL